MSVEEEQLRWRAAVQTFEDAQPPNLDDDAPEPELLWDALHGKLSNADALRATAAALAAPHGHEELRLLIQLERELEVPVATVVEGVRWRRWVVGGVAALAAAVLVALALRPPEPSAPSPGVELRAPATTAVVSHLDGGVLPRDAFELRWDVPGEDCSYALRASTARGDLVAQYRGATEPRWTIESAALAAVPDGEKILWQVDFECGDTSGRSQTFITQVAATP